MTYAKAKYINSWQKPDNIPLVSDGYDGMVFQGLSLVSAGDQSLAMDPSGYAWGWGNGADGQLGQGTTVANFSSPVSVVGGRQFIQVAASVSFSIALDVSGYAWGWGLNSSGQLGQGTTLANFSSPVSVVGGKQFSQIAAGSYVVIAIDQAGYAWGWGRNSSGELGQGTTLASASSPVSIVGGKQFLQVAAGFDHVSACDLNGYAWSWGDNTSGQLGQGTTLANFSSPVSVVGGKQFIQISAGSAFSFALDTLGYAWTWGKNTSGQLGQGTTLASFSSPVSVVGGNQFMQISAGIGHCLALDLSGYVWSWGDNTYGQLGINVAGDRSSPASVVGGKRFTQVAAGSTHSLAIDTSGNIWSWGDNTNGQLGINIAGSMSSPVMVVRQF